jgi:hypothetical protein
VAGEDFNHKGIVKLNPFITVDLAYFGSQGLIKNRTPAP